MKLKLQHCSKPDKDAVVIQNCVSSYNDHSVKTIFILGFGQHGDITFILLWLGVLHHIIQNSLMFWKLWKQQKRTKLKQNSIFLAPEIKYLLLYHSRDFPCICKHTCRLYIDVIISFVCSSCFLKKCSTNYGHLSLSLQIDAFKFFF